MPGIYRRGAGQLQMIGDDRADRKLANGASNETVLTVGCSLLSNQARALQILQMEGQRGRNEPNALANKAGGHPFRALLNQNQYGFSGGGPVLKNKLFVFGTGQWLKVRQGRATTAGLPPTALERAGDYSKNPRALTDPLARAPFPGNIIPRNRLDPVASKAFDLLPLPNSSLLLSALICLKKEPPDLAAASKSVYSLAPSAPS